MLRPLRKAPFFLSRDFLPSKLKGTNSEGIRKIPEKILLKI